MSKKKTKITLGFIATVVVGILSSALWDLIKPMTHVIYKFILNLSILGIEKFKDDIYLDIAKGLHENTSIEIYIFINIIMLSFFVSTILVFSKKLLQSNDSHKIANVIDKFFFWQRNLTPRNLLLILVVYALFASTVVTLGLVKTRYENSAVTHYKQLLEIVAPYISREEQLKIMSDFAQIKNKSDYQKVLSKLEKVSEDNKIKTPDFDFVF